MGEEIQVILARLEGRVESLTAVVELRMRTQERDVETWRLAGDQVHRELRSDIEQVKGTVVALQEFKSKVIGFAIGLSLVSGTVSGVMVALLTNAS